MKRRPSFPFLAVTWTLAAVFACPAAAATGDVISSFPAPDSGPFGLAWDGTSLWVNDDSAERIFELTPAGAVLSSFPFPPCQFAKGLTFDGTNLHTPCDSTDRIYEVTRGGSVIADIPTPAGEARGLTWDGANFWIADNGTDRIYEVTPSGTTLSSFPTPAGNPRGLTWDGANLWLADNSTDTVYELTTAGVVLSTFSTPGTNPRGLTYDGSDFWIVDQGTDLIYRLEGIGPVISGTVFEDVNYGGGVGRDRSTAAVDAPSFSIGRSGVTVELYDAAGGFLAATTTDGTGAYRFAGQGASTFTVRVVNGTVRSSRPGSDGSELGVQTYRVDGMSETPGTGASRVGGEQPSAEDAAANGGAQSLAALQGTDLDTDGVPEWTQSIVSVDTSGGDVTDVDFGFNFDTIVNTNDAGQGTLRQFVINANRLN